MRSETLKAVKCDALDFSVADRTALIVRVCEHIRLEAQCRAFLARNPFLWTDMDYSLHVHMLEQEVQQRLWTVWKPEYDGADPELDVPGEGWSLPKWASLVARNTMCEWARDRVRAGLTGAPHAGVHVAQLEAILEVDEDNDGELAATLTLLDRPGRSRKATCKRIARRIDPSADPDTTWDRAQRTAHTLLVGLDMAGRSDATEKILAMLCSGVTGARLVVRTAFDQAWAGGPADTDGMLALVDRKEHSADGEDDIVADKTTKRKRAKRPRRRAVTIRRNRPMTERDHE